MGLFLKAYTLKVRHFILLQFYLAVNDLIRVFNLLKRKISIESLSFQKICFQELQVCLEKIQRGDF